MKKKLKRVKQCIKCPWKISTNPHEIHNYIEKNHHKLISTIASDLYIKNQIRAMACHESKQGSEEYCIGWLINQLGPGNNLSLRLKMMNYDLSEVQLDGEQHKSFEDTLPGVTL